MNIKFWAVLFVAVVFVGATSAHAQRRPRALLGTPVVTPPPAPKPIVSQR